MQEFVFPLRFYYVLISLVVDDQIEYLKLGGITGADPGFPVGGVDPFWGGHGPPMQALFSENVCGNERIGSHGGGHAPENFVCRSAIA